MYNLFTDIADGTLSSAFVIKTKVPFSDDMQYRHIDLTQCSMTIGRLPHAPQGDGGEPYLNSLMYAVEHLLADKPGFQNGSTCISRHGSGSARFETADNLQNAVAVLNEQMHAATGIFVFKGAKYALRFSNTEGSGRPRALICAADMLRLLKPLLEGKCDGFAVQTFNTYRDAMQSAECDVDEKYPHNTLVVGKKGQNQLGTPQRCSAYTMFNTPLGKYSDSAFSSFANGSDHDAIYKRSHPVSDESRRSHRSNTYPYDTSCVPVSPAQTPSKNGVSSLNADAPEFVPSHCATDGNLGVDHDGEDDQLNDADEGIDYAGTSGNNAPSKTIDMGTPTTPADEGIPIQASVATAHGEHSAASSCVTFSLPDADDCARARGSSTVDLDLHGNPPQDRRETASYGSMYSRPGEIQGEPERNEVVLENCGVSIYV